MANIAINPTCKLDKCYFNADVKQASDIELLDNFLMTYGLPVTVGSHNGFQLYFYVTDTIKCYVVSEHTETPGFTNPISITVEFQLAGGVEHAYMARSYNESVWFPAGHWFKWSEEYQEWAEVSGELEIDINSTENGQTSYTEGEQTFIINEFRNTYLSEKSFVYMKGDAPTPTEEDFKHYVDRVKKFITRMQGKKISQGE